MYNGKSSGIRPKAKKKIKTIRTNHFQKQSKLTTGLFYFFFFNCDNWQNKWILYLNNKLCESFKLDWFTNEIWLKLTYKMNELNGIKKTFERITVSVALDINAYWMNGKVFDALVYIDNFLFMICVFSFAFLYIYALLTHPLQHCFK